MKRLDYCCRAGTPYLAGRPVVARLAPFLCDPAVLPPPGRMAGQPGSLPMPVLQGLRDRMTPVSDRKGDPIVEPTFNWHFIGPRATTAVKAGMGVKLSWLFPFRCMRRELPPFPPSRRRGTRMDPFEPPCPCSRPSRAALGDTFPTGPRRVPVPPPPPPYHRERGRG